MVCRPGNFHSGSEMKRPGFIAKRRLMLVLFGFYYEQIYACYGIIVE